MLNKHLRARFLALIIAIMTATAIGVSLWQTAAAAAPASNNRQTHDAQSTSADSRRINPGSTAYWQVKPAALAITEGMKINEADAETEDFDVEEFIELFDGGVGSTPLDGLVVVLYNGLYDLSYAAFDLDGFSSDSQGYFLLGSAAVPGVDLIFANGILQNGPDAIAVYAGDAVDFPNGTPIKTNNLIDALVYGTDDSDDSALLTLLLPGQPQVNENSRGIAEIDSNQRCPNGQGGQRQTLNYVQNTPTPGIENDCVFDTAPGVVSTQPRDGDTDIAVDAQIVIAFSEDVAADPGWFAIDCNLSGTHTAAVDNDGAIFTLDPDLDFSAGETCQVTIFAQKVHDLDEVDPPNNLEANYQWQFSTYAPPLAESMVINEVDADTLDDDSVEFIELYDGGVGDTALFGLTVVLYNGYNSLSYKSFDLDGFSTDEDGYFVLGNAAVAGVDLVFVNEVLQNGPDAVALFAGDAADFPVGSPVTIENLIDALVYGTNDADNEELLRLLHEGQPQVNEAGRGSPELYSNQRCPNGQGGQRNTKSYLQNDPTPDAINNCLFDLPPQVESTFPISGAENVALDTNLMVTFDEEVVVDEQWFTLSCALSGEHTVNTSGGPQTFILDPQEPFVPAENCLATVLGNLVTDIDGLSQTMTADYSWPFSTGLKNFGSCGDPSLSIQTVQGNGPVSPFVGTPGVIIEGVVTADFRGAQALGGYFIQQVHKHPQDNTANSDGLFIQDSDPELILNPGLKVRVQGDVAEIDGLTSLSNVVNFTGCSIGVPISPTLAVLPVANISDWEMLEGMLLSITETLAATGNADLGSAGEVQLAPSARLYQPTETALPGSDAAAVADLNERSQITLDDGSLITTPLPLPPYLGLSNTLRIGDTITNLVGILTENSISYRIQPTESVNFARDNERPSAAPDLIGSLRLMVFDTGDYFNGNGLGGGFPGARGAQSAAEFARQRAKLISALSASNADILALTSLENDGFGPFSAIQDLLNGLNDAAPAGHSYAFVALALPQIGQTETAVGLIYRQETVAPFGPAVTNHSTLFASLNNQPLVQTFQEIDSGETFVVAVTQLQSRAECPQTPGPNSDQGDGQGCYNLLRTQTAYELDKWLKTDPTGSGEDDIIILGDLNAYSMEDPLFVLEKAGYSNLAAQFTSSAYTSVTDNQTGALFHALATPTLSAQTTNLVHWHINADEPQALDYRSTNQPDLYQADYYRSSATDPILIDLALAAVHVNFSSDEPVYIGQVMHFTNESSGAGISGYEWDFGDGSPTETTADVQHLYASTGYYVVTLTVTTIWGESSAFSRMVLVQPAQTFLPSIAK